MTLRKGAGPAFGRWPAGRAWAGFLLVALALLALEFSGIDLALQRALFDPAAQRFPWRGVPVVELWLHQGARRALSLFPAYALGGWIVCAVRARRGARAAARARSGRHARRWRYLFVAMLLAPAAVSLAKQLTDRPCPWDLAEFGGASARRPGLFQPAVPGERALACFPAGHASGGFALFALGLAGGVPGLRRPRAGTWCVVAAAGGLLLGAIRVMQGAHFASHVLWSAWLVCLVQWGLARCLLRPEGRRAGRARAAPASLA